ncbi:hypothetical protein [Streptoalloteichus hindustanus]|uniref:Uncharacterized protein n=1 Tax=Streptoalloteichus hindustanus TaxID=2017 RepID=A0A1M5CWL4_STRHI|nr:hypothetical protein [Streptoalloteichus hindustanus]SHF59123.1 hypothetical protein SAMN05444320_104201 [Streptoalloteichus hindustanus]
MSKLERRYRRLLACYPRDHRERNGEEMLGVLMAGAGDRRAPGWRESVDLLWGAARLHLRRVVAADGGIEPRDVLAIVSLLGPIALLTGATTGLHELGWWVQAGALSEMPWTGQIPDAPVWCVWLAVAVLSLLRLRRAAAVGAWLGTAGFVFLATVFPAQHWWTALDAGWVLLGALTAVALTWSPGPTRGRELVGGKAVATMAATVVVAVVLGVLADRYAVGELLRLVVLVVGTVAACGARSRIGRRAALVLVLPVLITWPAKALMLSALVLPAPVEVAIFYGVPVVVLLALGALPRRVRRRRPGGATS